MTKPHAHPPWTESGWMDAARDWIEDALKTLGTTLDGPIEQPHVRLWSTVLRVPTSDGMVFFKACAPALAHEVAVTRAMARWVPEALPKILAADTKRGWMLMADGGPTVREFTQADGDIRHWLKLMPEYARLQITLADHVDELIALGLPDRRLAALPGRIEELLSRRDMLRIDFDEGLTSGEYQRLRGMKSEVSGLCDRLAALGIAESVHHGDFHDANVFLRGNRFVVFDWGDSSAAHPFFSLRTAFVSLEYILGLQEGAPEFGQLRDAYLDAWSEVGSREDLRSAFDLAACLSPLASALSWNRVISSLPPDQRGDYAGAVPSLLREFLEGVDLRG